MSTALTILQALRGEIDRGAPSQYILQRLDEIEAAIRGEFGRSRKGTKLAEALIAFAALGEGATPTMLGQALDASKEGYHAGALGSKRLDRLRKVGFARKAHFGWWVLTNAGTAEVARLLAEASTEGAGA